MQPARAVTALSSKPGGVSLFARTVDGSVYSSFFDPDGANADWSPWFPRAPARTTETDLAAVSSLPGGVSLFAVSPSGEVRSSFYDPRLAAPGCSPWITLPPPCTLPPYPTLSPSSSKPGGVSLFARTVDGSVYSSFFDPDGANADWSPWFPRSEERRVGNELAAVSSVPGGVSLFAVSPSGEVRSSFYDPRIAAPGW